MHTIDASPAERQIPPSAEVQAETDKRRAFTGYDWAAKVDQLAVTPTTKRVAQALARHWNSKTRQCNPKQQTLADELRIKEDTVYRAVRTLRDEGWLAIEHGRGNRSSYRLLEPYSEPDVDPVLDLPEPDVYPVLEPDEHPVPTRTTKRNYESRSRSGGEDDAREPARSTTTTTNIPPEDVQDAIEHWYAPLRREPSRAIAAQDRERAAVLLDAGYTPRAINDIALYANEADQYTRDRLRGIPAIAHFEALVDKHNAAHIDCERCGERFLPGSEDDQICIPCWVRDTNERKARQEREQKEREAERERLGPVVECVVNGCSTRFHSHEPPSLKRMCPYCTNHFEQTDESGDDIPWEWEHAT